MSRKISPAQRLLEQLARTEAEEISCDECFDLLDEFAELAHEGRDAEGVMPLVKQHLDVCRDCSEEFEALMEVLSGAEGS